MAEVSESNIDQVEETTLEENTNSSTANTFTKDKILKSNKYRHKVDLVNALLDKSKTYTLPEVDTLLESFLKGAAK
jgi:cobalamin biosynthesis Co2+ chelatase CbiK